MPEDNSSIEVIINGFKETVPRGASISELILNYDEMDAAMIVERNGRFVYPRDYPTTQAQPGDVLEFIHPDFGG